MSLTREPDKIICVNCRSVITCFRDRLSKKEFYISGLCQECQDIFFGTDEDKFVHDPEIV